MTASHQSINLSVIFQSIVTDPIHLELIQAMNILLMIYINSIEIEF